MMRSLRSLSVVMALTALPAFGQIIQDSSLLFHYDAADLNADGLPEAVPNGTRISQWNDKSGAGRNLQRASAVTGATNSYADNIFYLPNSMNGMPALHFGNQIGSNGAGSIDYMVGPLLSGTQLGGASGNQMTMFMVKRKHAFTVEAQWEATQRVGFEGTARWDWVNGTAASGQYVPVVTTNTAPTFLGGQFVVYTAERTGTSPPSGLTAETQYVYVNGTQETKIQTVAGLNLLGTNIGRWGFGGQNSGGNLAHVDFAEIIYYNRHLTPAERVQVETYLKKKYSIDAASANKGVYINKAAGVFAQYGGTYSTSINGAGVETVDRLFDNAPATKMLVAATGATNINVVVGFPTDRLPSILSYNITSANDVAGRDPKNWNFQGSNDGTTWTTLDARTNEAFASRLLTKTYALAAVATNRFYRLNITANNGDATNTQLAEWSFNTALTNTNPTITGSPAGNQTTTAVEIAANLFDRRTDTKYLASNAATAIVTAQLTSAEVIRAYTVATANDVATRDPRNFNLEGSNDGTTWTVLDTQTDVVWQARYQLREFNIANSTAYNRYRLNITKNWGDPSTQLSEFAILNYSATTDSDADGAADAREFQEYGNLATVTSGDTDGDGMPDGYEFTNTSPRSTTALAPAADADGDGRTNLEEFTAGTKALVADSDNDGLNDGAEATAGTNPLVADTDGDGLNDGLEVNTSLTNPLLADTDGDGIKDGIERSAGTDPNSNISTPVFLPSIGINFAENNLDLIQPWEVVGARGYRQANWNHLMGFNQPLAAGSVKDSTGTVVAGLGITSTVGAVNRGRVGDNNGVFNRLMNGWFSDSTTVDNPTLTLTGIPYANYDVVIYTESETANAIMGGYKVVDPANAANVYAQNSYFRALNSTLGNNLDSAFSVIDLPGGNQATPMAGNTIVFRNLTQSSIKIVARALTAYTRASVTAVQIVGTDPATDSDGDGLVDSREITNFGDLTAQSGTTDGDGDGRTNADELAAGTSFIMADSDGDGLNDGAEFTAGTNPLLTDTDGDGDSDFTELNTAPLTNPLVADTDGDGVKDGAERAAGTNPNDIASVPAFVNSIGVNFTETVGDALAPGEVAGAGNYRQANWMNVLGASGTNVACTNSSGAAVGTTTVTWATGGTFRAATSQNPSTFATSTRKLLVGYLDDNGTAGSDNPVITFNNIPYARYAMVIYAETDTGTISGSYRVVDPAAVGVNLKGPSFILPTAGLDSTITAQENGSSTGAAATASNALIFNNLTGTNVRLIGQRQATPASRASVTAIQIVDTTTTVDTDADGLSDNWETIYFGVLAQAAAGDFDGDGLTNLQEYTAGTNPTLVDTDNDGVPDGEEINVLLTNPLLADTDSDGLTDLQEKYLTTNGAVTDTDGDGVLDGREVALGSDPKVAGSLPSAGLLFYEGYSNKLYGAGSLAAQPLASLYSPRTATALIGPTTVVENSLTYGPLAVGGGRVRQTNLGLTTTAELYTTLDVGGASTFTGAGLVNGGYIGGSTTAGTVYMSFLYRCNRLARDASGNLNGVGKAFFGFQMYRDATEIMGMGESTASGNFGIFAVPGDLPATPAYATDNAVHLVVARVDYKNGAADDVKVWLDPNPLAAEASQLASVPTSVKVTAGDLSFNRLAMRGSTADTDHNVEYDEVRIGTSWTAVLPTVSSALVINEIGATGGVQDDDGNDEDWIELYNGGIASVDLSGYKLKDSVATWVFPTLSPAITLQPGQHLVVMASSKDAVKRPSYTATSVLHTNFKLAATGEYLALLDPSDFVLTEIAPGFPAQQSGYTYGLKDGAYGFMQPSPGGVNNSSFAAVPAVITVSQNSGVFTAPVTVTLSGQAPGQLIRYTLDGSIPSIGNGFTYVNPFTVSATAQMRCRVAQPGLEGPISSEIYLFPSATAQPDATSTYTIPIVVADTSGRAIQAGDANTHEFPTQASFVFYENVPVGGVSLASTPPSTFSRGIIGVRGKTSSGEAKKPYGIKFWGEENDDTKKRPLFGLPSADSWVLYAPDSFDKSGLRNVLMYELSRQMGQWAPNCRLVELYLNTSGGSLTNAAYQGLYIFMEKPDRGKQRIDVDDITPYDNAEPDVSGGYILQINKLYATPPTDLRVGAGTYVPATGADVIVEFPDEVDTTLPQRTYLNTFFNEVEDAINANPGGAPTFTHPTTGKHYRDYIDVPSWIDHHVLNVAAMNVDGLRLSAKMYKPRNGKLFAGPVWDFDRSIDSNDGRDDNPLAWVGTSDATKFFRYGLWKAHNDPGGTATSPNGLAHGLLKDPDFMQAWVDRWRVIRTAGQPMANANINALLDGWQAQVFPTGATATTQCPANRNYLKWPAQNTPRTFPAIGLTTASLYSNEVGVMKDWMQKHLAFIDGNVLKTPDFGVAAGPVTTATALGLSSADHVPGTTKIFYTIDGTDPRPAGGAEPVPNGTTLFEYTGTFTLPAGHYVIKTRLYNGTLAAFDETVTTTKLSKWSAPNETYYFSDAVAAAAGNLVVSELMYHPADPSPAELTAGFFDSDQFEYIELLNVGASPIDLYEAAFSSGIDYHFKNGTITQLAPGGRMLIVKNLAAFTMRYGAGAAALVSGQFEGNDNFNNNGETVTIVDRVAAPILSFTYDDLAPWPLDADGLGRSLVLILPSSTSDHTVAASWRASVVAGGEPGGVDSRPFAGTADTDADSDGSTSLLEHAAGTSDTNANSGPAFTAGLVVEGANTYQTLSFVADLRADDITVAGQRSLGLDAWLSGSGEIVEISRVADTATGFVTITVRSAHPYLGPDREFLRVQVVRP